MATAAFTNETASGWQTVNFATPVRIDAHTTYVASYYAPQGHYAGDVNYFTVPRNNAPLHAPASTLGNGNGVFKYGPGGIFPNDTYASANYWVDVMFTPAPPPLDQGFGGPVLVVKSNARPFSKYYSEMLRGEGINSFTAIDITTVTATTLNQYDVVILGEMPLTAAQVIMFTNWVNSGGNLIAMRPDKQLAGLLGVSDQGSTLPQGYLLIDVNNPPGTGLPNHHAIPRHGRSLHGPQRHDDGSQTLQQRRHGYK